jgi:hypothetical protein
LKALEENYFIPNIHIYFGAFTAYANICRRHGMKLRALAAYVEQNCALSQNGQNYIIYELELCVFTESTE